MKKDKSSWEVVKQFYMDTFGIAPDLVEILADSDILIMCVSGSSNSSIAKMVNIDESVVSNILKKIMDFDGWKTDLDINPLFEYSTLRVANNKNGYPLFKDFKNTVVTKSNFKDSTPSVIPEMFRICKLYDSISNRIEKEWI